MSNNDWMTIGVAVSAIAIAAAWRILDLLLPKGRMSKWVYDNTVEIEPEEENENG